MTVRINSEPVVEVITQAVLSGETSKAITFTVPRITADTDFTVLVEADYAANAFITSKANTGFTVNFSNPGATKGLKLVVMHNLPIR